MASIAGKLATSVIKVAAAWLNYWVWINFLSLPVKFPGFQPKEETPH